MWVSCGEVLLLGFVGLLLEFTIECRETCA